MITDADQPIISVVVGVLNGAKTMEKFIDSFAAQSLGRKELVIQDGGSTDGTIEILKRRAADIAHWETGKDKNLSDAWNKAIAHCRGQYIGFLGSDDEFADPSVLERLARNAEVPTPPELICSLNVLVTDDGRFLRTTGLPWSWKGLQRAQILAHACLLHRRDIFERLGGFDTRYRIGGDYDLLLRLGPETTSTFVDQITVRVGSNGMSHRLWTRTFGEHFQLQARNPNVGPRIAVRNYSGNVARYLLRKARGKR